MKVLYIINAFSWGGAEKLVYDLAIKMTEEVEKVAVIALYRKNDDTEKKMLHSLEMAHVSGSILDKREGKDRLKSVIEIAQFIRKNSIDVVHAHCSVPMLLGKFATMITRTPIVCTIHNTKGYSKMQEVMTSFLVSKYVSIGQAAEQYMIEELNISKNKIVRIYNAIDVGKFVPKDKNQGFWAQYGGDDNQITLLNVARVTEQKNQMCILRAIKKCLENKVNVKLYILGYYSEQDETFQRLKKYIIDHNMSKYVVFLGMHNDVRPFLINADCFVMSSWYEGLSVAFLEAVLSKTPIISSSLPFVDELNSISKCCIIFEQNDDNQLYKLIKTRKFIPQSEETLQRFKKIFSLDKYLQDHIDLYKSIQ